MPPLQARFSSGKREYSRFLGMGAPTLLTMGEYHKLVKTLGPQ